jgi:hypothetical protein
MNGFFAPKRLLAGLLVLVFAVVIAQAAAAGEGIPSAQYRYDNGVWFLLQRNHPVAKAKTRQYRYHEGHWILVKPLSSSKA